MRRIITTVKLTPRRQQPEHMHKLRRYAMHRFMLAWAAKHHHFATTCFTAVERAERLSRLIAS